MYIPKDFRNTNNTELYEFIRTNGFGLLISEANNRPWATHIPLRLSKDETKLQGHIARGNVQWKNFNSEKEVLVVFSGPHSYVSSSWYTHENVPTWNYVAVHVYGTIKLIEGEELLASLKDLVDHYESGSQNPVSIEKMTPSYLAKEIRGIVGFEIQITQIEASYKLSQNRNPEDYHRIISELDNSTDPDAKAVAMEMKKRAKE